MKKGTMDFVGDWQEEIKKTGIQVHNTLVKIQ